MYRTVVTMSTASLTFNNSTFCPQGCIYVFCVDLRTAIISLYNINWLVFITETVSGYCAVRTGCIVIRSNFRFSVANCHGRLHIQLLRLFKSLQFSYWGTHQLSHHTGLSLSLSLSLKHPRSISIQWIIVIPFPQRLVWVSAFIHVSLLTTNTIRTKHSVINAMPLTANNQAVDKDLSFPFRQHTERDVTSRFHKKKGSVIVLKKLDMFQPNYSRSNDFLRHHQLVIYSLLQ